MSENQANLGNSNTGDEPVSQGMTPQGPAPEYSAPEHAAPEHFAQEHVTPEHVTPEYTASEYAAPQHGVPQHAVPQSAAPQDAGPQAGSTDWPKPPESVWQQPSPVSQTPVSQTPVSQTPISQTSAPSGPYPPAPAYPPMDQTAQQPWSDQGPIGYQYPPQYPPQGPPTQQWAQPWPGAPVTAVPEKKKRSGGRIGLAAGAVAIALAAGGVGGVVGQQFGDHGGTTTVQNITSTAPIVDRSSLAEIAAKLQPSVVVISTERGEGSGVVVSADGYIVTNNHVVATATGDSVDVTFNSGKKVEGRIIGADPRTDLAVVQVSGVGDLVFAKWGDSDKVQVGDTVLAIGSPLGLQGSVTAGIVSALHRTITVGDENGQSGTTIGDAIQTDAPINPGNSGGALVNTAGEVVGINSAIATSGQGSNGNIGVGFAISANKAKSVTDQIIKGGAVSHPFLGVSVTAADAGGALVKSVQANSPAEKAGIKEGDIITKINGRVVTGSEDLIGAVQGGSVGGTLQITFTRGGAEQTVSATLVEAPK